MRSSTLPLALAALAVLACTGAVEDVPTDAPGDEVPEAPAKKPKKGKKPTTPGVGAPTTGAPGDGDDGGGDGGGGGGGGDDGGAQPAPSPSPAPVAPPPPGIEQVDATTWKIDKELKDKWMANPQKFGSAKRKGKGYELGSIGTGSDGWYCGLRNGDVVKEVNGHSLETDSEALAAYAELQDAKRLVVKMRRGEGPLTHTYLIE